MNRLLVVARNILRVSAAEDAAVVVLVVAVYITETHRHTYTHLAVFDSEITYYNFKLLSGIPSHYPSISTFKRRLKSFYFNSLVS